MSFHVGQKVVCINSSGPAARHGIRVGRIYVIAGINGEYVQIGETGQCLWFRERFRPVIERKIDISIFTRMLTPAPKILEPTAQMREHDIFALDKLADQVTAPNVPHESSLVNQI